MTHRRAPRDLQGMARAAVAAVAVLALLGGAPAAASRAIDPPVTGSPGGAGAFAHVEHYAGQAELHRTGTAGGRMTADWVRGVFKDAGLDVEVDPWTFPRFVPSEVRLEVGSFAPEVFPFYYSGVTGPEGITAELVDVGRGMELLTGRADVDGKIVLAEIPTVQNALTPTFARAQQAARDGGAVGFVAAIAGPGNHIVAQNSESQSGLCSFPTVVVGKVDGAELAELDGTPATLVLDAAYHDGSQVDADGEPLIGRSENVLGTIQGSGEGLIVIATPLNGWFAGATERGTGIGVFLELARHYAAGPTPEQTLVFVATGGHEVGFLGVHELIAQRPELLEDATAYVHIGATIAAKQYLEEGGQIIETGLPEPLRSLFVSENPLLMEISQRAMRGAGLAGPPSSMAPVVQNPGEPQLVYRLGVPLIQVSGGSLYFHTPGDVASTTSAALLDPMVTAFRDIVDDLLAQDRETVHRANLLARSFGEFGGGSAVVHRCG